VPHLRRLRRRPVCGVRRDRRNEAQVNYACATRRGSRRGFFMSLDAGGPFR
jgi:hypothetical protein